MGYLSGSNLSLVVTNGSYLLIAGILSQQQRPRYLQALHFAFIEGTDMAT